MIPEELIDEYYSRLISVHDGKRFIDQFLQGSGNELQKKFWSEHSSSRLAFDLYSWIPDVIFEKQLPGVVCSKSGPAGVPNMDVFIDCNDALVFIESKYTESAGLSYTNGNEPALSKAYWSNDVHGGLSIDKRFYGNKGIADKFSKFCMSIQNDINSITKNKWKWFDVKQETCHLFGIIFYALNARREGKEYVCATKTSITKPIRLYNVIWKLKDDNFSLDDNSLPSIFKKKADDLVGEILDVDFKFEVITVQELMKKEDFHGLNFKEARSFMKDIRVSEQMEQYEIDFKRGSSTSNFNNKY